METYFCAFKSHYSIQRNNDNNVKCYTSIHIISINKDILNLIMTFISAIYRMF